MEEFFIVFTVLVLTPLSIFYGIKMLRESKYKAMAEGRIDRDGSSEGTMRRSELENLIHDAVVEATAPLAARIDELERELLLGEGESRLGAGTLAEAFDDKEDEENVPQRRRDRA